MQNYQNRDGPPAQGFNGPPPPPGQNQMPPHHGQGNMPPSPPPHAGGGQPNYQPQTPNTEAGYYQQGGAPGIKVVTKVTKGTQGRPTKVVTLATKVAHLVTLVATHHFHLPTTEATPTHRHMRVVAILATLAATKDAKANEHDQEYNCISRHPCSTVAFWKRWCASVV